MEYILKRELVPIASRVVLKNAFTLKDPKQLLFL
ncbi:hypothetical protein TOT_030000159 [Theileria orientalis strain Shintoku]|uniref:Uncharacterized protein n=1 Tax=Theileria orientalis strain Shintoku TaxID=869250 RepID=J4C8J5_THEOR|nr:hypothetical protein TOT_030000159 [Theileria orientalis strain Shintoku]BAM40898.1 hypothetical protein TOT_030000159 [Theileria orientalis strain Shintoku]|eukprot:XP_009691199.1 hypothetical protein TOT_030000159 [Theileria orientalis strain Shintoku]